MLKNTNAMHKKLTKETRLLNNYDLNVLVPILIKGLEIKKGKRNAVTASQIVNRLQCNGLKINQRHIFRIISYIRMNDLLVGLMASSNGYYITDNEQELIKYEKRLMSKEIEIRKVRMSMKRQRAAMFKKPSNQQTHLF